MGAHVLVPREEVFTGSHPLWLKGRLRVDHEIVDRLQRGTGAWAGDPRLALYVNAGENRWELWRLEHDGKYRPVGRQQRPGPGQRGQRLGEELLNTILTELVSRDVRKGYDVVADVEAHEEKRDADLDADLSDFITGDFADRFRFALKKDGALDHCTGE